MADDTFGIGFVSAGFITRDLHAPSLQYILNADVGGIANPTRSNGEELAEECREMNIGDPDVYSVDEIADLADNPKVDGILVTSPNFTRLTVVNAVCDAVEDGAELQGIALEKPVARNMAETK